MSVKKKPAIPDYEAFGDELSPPVAFLQSASLLDIAGQFAVESRDVDGITTVSVLWMQLGERMMNGGRLVSNSEEEEDDDEEELESEPSKYPIGFAGSQNTKEIEVENE